MSLRELTSGSPMTMDRKRFMINSRKYLKSLTLNEINIPSNIMQQFAGDWYGLMASQKIDKEVWFVSLLTSGLNAPEEFDGNQLRVLVPERSSLEELLIRLKVQKNSGNY
jgi:hypothetical protein